MKKYNLIFKIAILNIKINVSFIIFINFYLIKHIIKI